MLAQALQSLGFAEKEARIYLSALSSGRQTAQGLSQATAIPRATVYLQIDSLKTRGLLEPFEENGKTLYRAAPPEQILEQLRAERNELERRESAAHTVVTTLKSLTPESNLPRVQLFEGADGLEAMRAELLKHRNIEWYAASGLSHYRAAVDEVSRKRQYERLFELANRCKAIIAGTDEPPFPDPIKFLYERYLVPPDTFPMPGEVAIFDDTIVFTSYRDGPAGVLIKDRDLATVMRSLFRLAYERTKLYTRLDK